MQEKAPEEKETVDWGQRMAGLEKDTADLKRRIEEQDNRHCLDGARGKRKRQPAAGSWKSE